MGTGPDDRLVLRFAWIADPVAKESMEGITLSGSQATLFVLTVIGIAVLIG